MGLMNAAGTFGMFVGNLVAGAVAAIALSSGFDRPAAYSAVFAVAGASQVLSAVVSRSFRPR